MSAVKSSVMALLLLSACGGNPFPGPLPPPPPPVPGNVSVSDLPGTTNPTATGDISRSEAKDKGPGGSSVPGNGFAQGFSYDPAADTFTVDNLAFDGGNVYQRDPKVPTKGPAKVYSGSGTFPDTVTGTPINQFSYRALYGVSNSGKASFAIVRTGAYQGYGFGGFIYGRTGGVTLPTTGQANYAGAYAGLRDFNGGGSVGSKLQYTTATMSMSIDFNDFNAASSSTSNGAGIKGTLSNRHVFNLAGVDVTNAVLAEINADKNPDFPLGGGVLPTLVFDVGPGVLDNNGEAEGGIGNTILVSGAVTPLERGKYYAVIAGDATAGTEEVAGVIVVEATYSNGTARETGGFILYRK